MKGFAETIRLIQEGGYSPAEIYNQTISEMNLSDADAERVMRMIREMKKADAAFLESVLNEEKNREKK